jgi:aerobic carbon-monoxide dehydrogenase medium subunit
MPGPRYERAHSIEEAVALLEPLGDDAHVLAGGQSLVVLMNLGLAEPAALVDIDRIPGLSYVRRTDGRLRVGALTRHAEVEHHARDLGGFAVLQRAARGIAYPAIRERGTFAGVLAHADPTGEWCSLVLALDATIVVAGPQGRRRIPATELFDAPLLTTLRHGEIIVEVDFPHEFDHAELRKVEPLHPDFPAIIVAAAYDRAGATLRRVRVAVGGAGGPAQRAAAAEAALEGAEAADAAALAEAAHAAAAGLSPHAADAAGVRYCRRVVTALLRRALEPV